MAGKPNGFAGAQIRWAVSQTLENYGFHASARLSKEEFEKAENLANVLRAIVADPEHPEGTWKDWARKALKEWDEWENRG